MHPLLSINNLDIDFVTENGRVEAVRDISFTVNRGEIVGIAGESGSGKSVSSLSIPRLLSTPPTEYVSGEILFSTDGNKQTNMLQVEKNELRRLRGGEIGVIFQEPMTSLNPVFTCGDQVIEPVLLHNKLNKQEARAKALALFEQVKLPDPTNIFDRYPHQLSGGQKQRVMIAMAMSGNPSLLICDEPTTALDVTVQKNILLLIRELQASTNMGVIFITHDLGVIAEIASRVIIMNKGRIVEQGEVRNIFQSPKHPYTKALLACRPSLYTKGTRLPVVSDFLQEKTTLSQRHEIRTARQVQIGEDVLVGVKNLEVWFPSKQSFTGKPLEFNKAVDDVSFDIKRGETLGLVGESGCGKTTIGRALLKLVEPKAGLMLFNGRSINRLRGEGLREFRTRVQIIFQDPYSSLNPSITVGHALSEPLWVHRRGAGNKQIREEVIELLEKVDLKADHFHRYPHEFSGGQRQRIVIARALALKPEFIVCDESVSALDVSVQAQVLNLLNDLKTEFGFTSLFISHDLSVIRYISDRIIVMRKGVIEESGAAEEVYNRPQSDYTRRLLDSVPKMKPN